jgi:hypothetical protein
MSRHVFKSRKDKLVYYIRHFIRHSRSKIWWKYFFISDVLSRTLFRTNDGCYIFEEDWDYLIILDACRFDIFKEEIKNYDVKGKLQYRVSRGSLTTQFLIENFINVDEELKKQLNKIIYISANPYVNILFKNEFYKIIPVWSFGWDDNLKTVPPDVVYRIALETIRKHWNKKVIIHFMQPHEPFVSLNNYKTTGFDRLRQAALYSKMNDVSSDTSIWNLVEKNYLKLDRAIKAYIKNLKWVMPYAIKLCKVLPGKTVITSDHGEAFGEKVHPLIPVRVYGHHNNVRIEPLIKVPWFISEERGDLGKVEKVLLQLKIRTITKLKMKM